MCYTLCISHCLFCFPPYISLLAAVLFLFVVCNEMSHFVPLTLCFDLVLLQPFRLHFSAEWQAKMLGIVFMQYQKSARKEELWI